MADEDVNLPMDSLEGPVPFFHDFFDVKDALEIAEPGSWKVSQDKDLLNAEEGKDGKKAKTALSFEVESDADNGAAFSATTKFVLKDGRIFGGLTFDPSRSNRYPIPAIQFVCPTSNQAVSVDPDQLVYQWTHPTFAAHARYSYWQGGIPVHGSLAACIAPKTFAGVCLTYDALRSGLRSSTVAVKHTTSDEKLTGTVSVDGLWNVGVTAAYKQCEKVTLLADILPSKDVLVGGVALENMTPHHDSTILLRGDWCNKLVSLAYSVCTNKWNIGVSATWNLSKGDHCPCHPKFGVSLEAE